MSTEALTSEAGRDIVEATSLPDYSDLPSCQKYVIDRLGMINGTVRARKAREAERQPISREKEVKEKADLCRSVLELGAMAEDWPEGKAFIPTSDVTPKQVMELAKQAIAEVMGIPTGAAEADLTKGVPVEMAEQLTKLGWVNIGELVAQEQRERITDLAMKKAGRFNELADKLRTVEHLAAISNIRLNEREKSELEKRFEEARKIPGNESKLMGQIMDEVGKSEDERNYLRARLYLETLLTCRFGCLSDELGDTKNMARLVREKMGQV